MHTATGFQLILNGVRVLGLLVLIHSPWINTHNFSALVGTDCTNLKIVIFTS